MTHLQAYIGLKLLAGGSKSKAEATVIFWHPERGEVFSATMSLLRTHCDSKQDSWDKSVQGFCFFTTYVTVDHVWLHFVGAIPSDNIYTMNCKNRV